MKQGGFIGLKVHPVKDFSIDVVLFPGMPTGTDNYTTNDVFTVEHDFRYAGESDGIHVGCPNGCWMALTADRFAELFGTEALGAIDSIPCEVVA